MINLSKKYSPKKWNGTVIYNVCIFVVFIMLCWQTPGVILYFSSNSKSENTFRKTLLSKKCYRNERMLLLSELIKGEDELNNNLGPIPAGKFISEYKGKMEYYGYWWNYFNYEFRIYSYDISNEIAWYEDENIAYKKYIKRIEEQFKQNYYEKSHYTKAVGCAAFVYYAYDNINVKRVFFCKNQRAYMVEVRAPYHIDECSGKVCDMIDVVNYHHIVNDKSDIIDYFLLASLFVLLPLIYVRIYGAGRKKKNKKAYNLFYASLFAQIGNLLIAMYQSYMLFTSYTGNKESDYVLLLTLSSFVFGGVFLPNYFLKKIYDEYSLDFMVPNYIKKYLGDRLEGIKEKRSIIALLIYPFCLISIVPLGIISLTYLIPMTVFTLLLLEIRKLYGWINGGMVQKTSDKIEFVDYYLVLDVIPSATNEEIERAYNKYMANLCSGNERNNLYKHRLIEAYRVLTSQNRMRPLYDKQYEKYKKSNTRNFEYTDVNLMKDLKQIRETIYSNKQLRYVDYITNFNLIIVALILTISLYLLLWHFSIYGNRNIKESNVSVPTISHDDEFDFENSYSDF